MAIDTSRKRFALLTLGSPQTLRVLPIPDGLYAAGDRLLFLGLYSFTVDPGGGGAWGIAHFYRRRRRA